MTIEYSINNLNERLQEEERLSHKQKKPSMIEYIQIISKLLEELIEAEGYECHSIFNSQEVPPISIQMYLQRLQKYTKFSSQCLIMAVIYLDRYNMAEPDFTLNKENVHRFFLTCLILAVKYHDDIYFDNLTFEKAGGVPVCQIMNFELEIITKIQFRCHVELDEYEALEQKLFSLYLFDKYE